METYETKPCTLSGFIHFCTNCAERRCVNGEWVKTNRRRGFTTWDGRHITRYEIVNVVLDAHYIVFHLKTENRVAYKTFSIYEVGWVYDTYGMMIFLHRDANGKEEIWNIS